MKAVDRLDYIEYCIKSIFWCQIEPPESQKNLACCFQQKNSIFALVLFGSISECLPICTMTNFWFTFLIFFYKTFINVTKYEVAKNVLTNLELKILVQIFL